MSEHRLAPLDLSSVHSDWIKVVVTLDRPSSEALAHCNRGEKVKILKKNAQCQRRNLVAWIEEHGLARQVAKVGVPTSLSLIFIQCTPHAAQELVYAPGVTSIMLTEDSGAVMHS